MDDKDDKKTPWFGPKRSGYGVGPRSWQGWLITALLVVVAISSVTIAHDKRPSWFKPKTHGSGFNPSTWQGWAATLIPIAIILLVVLSLYYKQNKED